MRRRSFLQQLAAIMGLAAFGRSACTADEDTRVAADSFADHWKKLTQDQPVVATHDITLTLPAVAENGAVVPLAIASRLENLQQLWILVEKNPSPLAATFQLSSHIDVTIHARIKMAESCNVHLLARQGDRWLHCRQWVKVMVGGCGTG